MTIVSEKATVRWNGLTRKHYESYEYVWTKQNDWFEVSIEHLMKTSPVKVDVKCDYCGTVTNRSYRDLFRNSKEVMKHCCSSRKCMVSKSKEVSLIKYGVENYTSTDDAKEYRRNLFQTEKDEVLKVASSKGITILNIDDYQNNKTRLFVVCSKHKDKGEQETNFANIKKNKHCCKYIKNEESKRRLDGNIVLEGFKSKELIPLFKAEDYEGNSQPLPYKCYKHMDKGVQYRTYANVIYGNCNGCYYCSIESRKEKSKLDFDIVKREFESKGLIILDDEKYESKERYLKCRCVKHHEEILMRTYSTVKYSKVSCPLCRNDKSLTELNRFLRSSLSNWKRKSEELCGYKCVITGSKNYDVHHLYPFNAIIKDVLKDLEIIMDDYDAKDIVRIKSEVINRHNEIMGVCLDKDLHVLFHKMYGKDTCAPSDFEEFKNKYIKGEIEGF